MANTEGPGGQPPAAWVWSHYRGVLPGEAEAPPRAVAPAVEAVAQGGRKLGAIGLGLAAAVVVIAGLTWLFATRSASGPAPESPPPATATESEPHKSEATPPATEPAPPAATPASDAAAPTAPAGETPKAAAPAEPHHGAEHGKKKKKH